MINILLSKSNQHPPSVKLSLPASRYDMLDACGKIGASDLNNARIIISTNKEVPNIVRTLLNAMVGNPNDNSFDQLNFFAHRLDSVSPQERLVMDGLCYMRAPGSMKELINMTFNLNNVHLVGNVGTEHELGKFLVENDFVEFPESVIPYLDFAKIGRERLAGNTCAIFNGMYIEDNRTPAEMLNVNVEISTDTQASPVFFVRIGNPAHETGNGLFAELNLPATDEEMTDALEFIGVEFLYNVVIDKFESRIADFADIADEHTDLSALNDLADQIGRMDDAEYIKYKAVVEYERVLPAADGTVHGELLQKLCGHSYQLEQYSFFPQYHDAESFGRYMLNTCKIPAWIKPHVNLREFGESQLSESNMRLGSYGVIRPEYEQKQAFAAEPEQVQQMGGM